MRVLRSATLVEPFEHVYSGDDAIDKSKPEWMEQYMSALERSDWSLLPLKPGATPAVWTLQHLVGRPRRKVLTYVSLCSRRNTLSPEALYALCAACLTGVKGLVDGDGLAIEVRQTMDPEDQMMCVPEHQMALLDTIDDGALVAELGNIAAGALYGAKKKSSTDSS